MKEKGRVEGMQQYLCNLVKLAEELVEHVNEFSRGTVAGEPGEADYIRIQNAAARQAHKHTGEIKETILEKIGILQKLSE